MALVGVVAGRSSRVGDGMLRFAILAAVGAMLLALIAPDLALSLLGNGASPPAAAPAKADVAQEAPAASSTSSAGRQAVLEADRGGQYAADVEINGYPVKMLVDTGATMVVISYATASRLGLHVLEADYTVRVRTANGVAAVAPVTLGNVTLGPIFLGGVQALVADRNAGSVDLLGMSFLKRLASVEQKSGRLILRQ
jgi:aspartyl protease family protein